MFGALIGGAADLAGGFLGSQAAGAASKQQQGAITGANNFLTTQNGVNQGYVSPYNATGTQANSLLSLMMSNPTAFQSQFQASPGYQYTLNQAQSATNNGAAAKGGLVGGNTAMALQSNASGLANQDYQSYIANLMGLQQTGLSAGNTQAQLGQNYGTTYANNLIGIGNAQSAGTIGAANAWGGALSGLGEAAAGGSQSAYNSLGSYLKGMV